jgi:hypothetical protein
VGRQVVVKELKSVAGWTLQREAKHLEMLLPAGSPHIVGLISNPGAIVGADEDLGPEWDGKIRRLFLEYCSFGSLHDLIERRIRL